MAFFNLAFGFDWTIRPNLVIPFAAQLQCCISQIVGAERSRMASFFGELNIGDVLDFSIVDITGDKSLELEVISTMIVFSRASRSTTGSSSPLECRYLAVAGDPLAATRTFEDNKAYDVEAAPTWSFRQTSIVHDGTFVFGAVAVVYDPITEALRTFILDPEMEVGSGT